MLAIFVMTKNLYLKKYNLSTQNLYCIFYSSKSVKKGHREETDCYPKDLEIFTRLMFQDTDFYPRFPKDLEIFSRDVHFYSSKIDILRVTAEIFCSNILIFMNKI